MITINYRDSRPIYEQIKNTFQQMIISGAITADTKLPSVRELASKLAINPNTIQRAYHELEEAGYIVSIPGKGSYAGDLSELCITYKKQLFDEFSNVAARLLAIGISYGELTNELELISKGVS